MTYNSQKEMLLALFEESLDQYEDDEIEHVYFSISTYSGEEYQVRVNDSDREVAGVC